MLETFLLCFAGLLLLYIGAEGLVRSSASLGLRFGITPLVVGLTIVGYGTSTPELLVNIQAALQGKGDIAIGNIVGSNIFNIAFILGVSSLLRPLKINPILLKIDIPIMILTAIVFYLISLSRTLQFWHGVVFLIGIFVYTFFIIWEAKKRHVVESLDAIPTLSKNMWLDIIICVASIGVLILGARWFLDGSISIARFFGISEAIIGLTLIAAGTSLPELATSAVASLSNHSDISLGNIVGSNIYNILAIMGMTLMIAPIYIENVLQRDFLVMIFFSLALGVVVFTQPVMKRWHGLLFLLGYCLYLYFLF